MNILENDDELNYVVFPVHYFQTKPNGLSLDPCFSVIFTFLATDPENDRWISLANLKLLKILFVIVSIVNSPKPGNVMGFMLMSSYVVYATMRSFHGVILE